MFDPKKLLDDLLGSQIPGTQGTLRDKAGQATQLAKDHPLAAGAIAAVLLGTGSGRAITGSALKLGGLAAIGGLAYQAYKNYQVGAQPAAAGAAPPPALPAPADSAFHPSQAPQGESAFALAVIRAMIAAAKADGRIDDSERERIGQRIGLSGLGSEAESFLAREMAAPVDIDAIAASAESEPQKVELYTAARLAIEPDSRAERGFLDLLAGKLDLPDALIEHVESTVAAAKAAPAGAAPQPVPVAPKPGGSVW